MVTEPSASRAKLRSLVCVLYLLQRLGAIGLVIVVINKHTIAIQITGLGVDVGGRRKAAAKEQIG
jgi:hypothetical protein